VASANFEPYPTPAITSISPSPNKAYSQSTIPLNVKVELGRFSPSPSIEQLAWLNYSVDGQPEVNASITNQYNSSTVDAFATGTLSNLADGAHSLYLHGQTTFANYPSLPETTFSQTVYFIVDTVAPTIHVSSPQPKTYTSTTVPLVFSSDKHLVWTGYGLDQNPVVTATTGTNLTSLSAGAHTVRVYGNDSAGDTCASQEVSFTLRDLEAPLVILDSASIVNLSYGHPVVPNMNTTLLPVIFEVNEPISWVTYSLDGAANVTIQGNNTISQVRFGNHSLIVYASDPSGNVGASQLCGFNIGIETRTSALFNVTKTTAIAPPTSQPSATANPPQANQPYPSTLPIIATFVIVAVIVIVIGSFYTRKRKHQTVEASVTSNVGNSRELSFSDRL
jgi:hypothetical protein